MAYKARKVSKTIENAKVRLAGMAAIDVKRNKTINYGGVDNPLTQTEMNAKIAAAEAKLAKYNQILDTADNELNEFLELEKEVANAYMTVLKGAVANFGDDSNEIEILGGTKRSERKRPARKSKKTEN